MSGFLLLHLLSLKPFGAPYRIRTCKKPVSETGASTIISAKEAYSVNSVSVSIQ